MRKTGHAWSGMSMAPAMLCCLFATGVPAPAQEQSLDALVRAYPNSL